MSIVDIFNIPKDDVTLAEWSRLHMMWHRSMNQQVLKVYNIALQEFAIDPIDFTKGSNFPQFHQTMHAALDAVLGVDPQDLLSIDWTDESARVGWFESHAFLSQQESNALGVFA